ncbi:MAG: type II toxin-antitoxin system HicA family toxin [Chloroflexi bacterium]|nr:type II toxin-antitoxin system HicA family toxin [Chloroflexota bacterium]
MNLPRDLDGDKLAKLLRPFDYEITRQVGSHIRLTTTRNGEHHITIPRHRPLRIGTLNAILRDVAQHLDMSRDELLDALL